MGALGVLKERSAKLKEAAAMIDDSLKVR